MKYHLYLPIILIVLLSTGCGGISIYSSSIRRNKNYKDELSSNIVSNVLLYSLKTSNELNPEMDAKIKGIGTEKMCDQLSDQLKNRGISVTKQHVEHFSHQASIENQDFESLLTSVKPTSPEAVIFIFCEGGRIRWTEDSEHKFFTPFYRVKVYTPLQNPETSSTKKYNLTRVYDIYEGYFDTKFNIPKELARELLNKEGKLR